MGEKTQVKRVRPLSAAAYTPVLAGGHGGYGVTPALIKAYGGIGQAQAAMAANGTPVSAAALAAWAASRQNPVNAVARDRKAPHVSRLNSPVRSPNASIYAGAQGTALRAVRASAIQADTAKQIAAFTTSGGSAPGMPASHAATVTRLYAELLGRTPDAEGLAYWVNVLATGQSEAYVRAEMKKSPEYQARVPAFMDIADGAAPRSPLVLLALAGAVIYLAARK